MSEPFDESWVRDCLERGRIEEVTQRVGRAGPAEPLASARAELAVRGLGPIQDLVLGARLRSPRAGRFAAMAAQRLGAIGARELGARVVAEARAAGADIGAAAWVDPEADDAALLALARDEGVERYLRRRALGLLAMRRRAERAFAEAAQLLLDGHALADGADDATSLMLAAGKDLWAANEPVRARELLGRARTLADAGATGDARGVRTRVGAVVDAIERAAGAAAAWTFASYRRERAVFSDARDAVDAALQANGIATATADGKLVDAVKQLEGMMSMPVSITIEPGPGQTKLDAPLPTLAHARHALRSHGIESLRCAMTPDKLAAALAAGAVVVLEEERPATTGFRVVLGWEATARLVFAVAEGRGAVLVEWCEQERRGAMFGMSALVVLGAAAVAEERRTALAAQGVAHEALFDMLDACEIDEDGQAPPRARVVELARAVLEKHPTSQLACKRWGDELLAAWRAERVALTTVMSWYADARERFPDAEWPAQIYAQVLEAEGRTHEAGIAWAEAQYRDPWDERNLLGHARALTRMERNDDAEALFRRAATLAPKLVATYSWTAQLALDRRDAETAEVCARISQELDPKHPAPMSMIATALEKLGRGDEALGWLERACDVDARDVWLWLRVARASAARGRWEAARKRADAAAESTRETAPHWWSARVAWCDGDRDSAWARIVRGIERCGFADDMLALAITIATSGTADERAARIGELRERAGTDPDRCGPLSFQLLLKRQFDDALAVAEAFAAAKPDDANGDWHVARALLYARRLAGDRERIEARLEKVFAAAPGFEAARSLLSLAKLSHDPKRALELASLEGATYSLASSWWVQMTALAALGDTARAAELDARQRALPADVVTRAVPPIRAACYFAEAEALCKRGIERHPADAMLHVELGIVHLRTGEGDALAPMLVARDAKPGAQITRELYEAARRAKRWDVVADAAAREIGWHDDTRRDDDVWVHRAHAAGAALAAGDDARRAELIAQAPKHPEALATLVRYEQTQQHAALAEDRARLEACAPGLAVEVQS